VNPQALKAGDREQIVPADVGRLPAEW